MSVVRANRGRAEALLDQPLLSADRGGVREHVWCLMFHKQMTVVTADGSGHFDRAEALLDLLPSVEAAKNMMTPS